MSGGGGASANNEITFNDTSEYMYRNSSTKRGGFEGNIARTTQNTSANTDGTEDIERVTDQLDPMDRATIRDQITEIVACIGPSFCADKADLATRAETAWDRAVALYADTKGAIDTEIADLKQEAIERICLQKTQWARTAGSSLNCLVQGMELKAEVELTRRLAGALAERLPQLKQLETAAIMDAFQQNFQAKAQMPQIAFAHVGNLWNILRGAQVSEVTDRGYTEGRTENQTTLQLAGKFYHESTDIADTDGKYESVGEDAISTSQGIMSTIGAFA